MAGRTEVISAAASLLRILLCGVFIYAGFRKALDPAAFTLAILSYRIVPYPAAVALALYLPWIEIISGLALLVSHWRKGALLLLAGLCLLFFGALASAWWRGLELSCGCFGVSSQPHLGWSLVRAAFLAIVACSLLAGQLGELRERPGRPSRNNADRPDR